MFGSGRLYAAFDEVGVAASTMFGLSLGGAQQWAKPLGGTDDVFMQQQRQPATGPAREPDGSLYLTGMGGANGWSLRRVQPNTGDILWGLLALAFERHVGAKRWPEWLCLSLAESQLPRLNHPSWAAALDVLRRLDHRPSRGQPRRQRRRRWEPPELRRAGFRSWLERRYGRTRNGRWIFRTRTVAIRSRTHHFASRPTARPRTLAPRSSGAVSEYSFVYAVGSGTGPPPPPPPPPCLGC